MKVCPICQSTRRFIPYAKFGDVNLRRCRNCDSITTSNRPTQLQAFSLHNNSDYFKHSYFCKRRNNIHYWKKLTKNIVQLAHAAKPFFSLSNQNHMDIGCDTGGLLKSFSKMYNTIPFGVDVSKAAIDYLSQNKINHFYGCLEDLKIPQTFKLITAVDVIEHIAEPLNFFKAVRKFLAHDGFFYFETPNTSSWIYRIGVLLNRLRLPFLKVYLERLFPPEHLQYYSRKGLKEIAKMAGLSILILKNKNIPSRVLGVSTLVNIGLQGLQLMDTKRSKILWCGAMSKNFNK